MFDRKYSDEVRERSVERVLQRRRDEPDNRFIVREVADEFEVGPQSLRKWLARARYDDGSYDYESDTPSPRPSEPTTSPDPRQSRKPTQRELLERISDLEQRVVVLQEDNRSLTRVLSLFAEELRSAARGTIHTLDELADIAPRI